MRTIKARPTIYKGIQMRSRLEARFAASLEGLCTWEYEPVCFGNEHGQYLPDFRCQWTHQDHTWVEVKPTWDHVAEAARRMDIILSSEPHASLAVYIPVGDSFHSAAYRMGGQRPWRYNQPNGTPRAPAWRPADAARAELARRRAARERTDHAAAERADMLDKLRRR